MALGYKIKVKVKRRFFLLSLYIYQCVSNEGKSEEFVFLCPFYLQHVTISGGRWTRNKAQRRLWRVVFIFIDCLLLVPRILDCSRCRLIFLMNWQQMGQLLVLIFFLDSLESSRTLFYTGWSGNIWPFSFCFYFS